MQLPPPPSTLGQHTSPQVITLELVPGHALGPFSLGMSLWSAMNYLRSHAEAYPSVRVVWPHPHPNPNPNSTLKPNAQAEAGAHDPVVLSLGRHVHLTFDAVWQRLQSIVLQSILTSAAPRPNVAGAHASTRSSTGTGTGRDMDEDQADPEFDPWHADPNVSQSWYRHIVVTYRGSALFATSPPHTGVSVLTRSVVHQMLGPTYPGRHFPEHPPWSHILSYPGVAFGFPPTPKHTTTTGITATQEQGYSSAAGEKGDSVSTIYLFNRGERHPFPAPGAREPPPLCAPTQGQAGDTSEPVWVQDAEVFPGQGVRLVLACYSPSHRTHHTHDKSIHTEPVELILGQTEVQDVLTDLGTPEARAWKEDERLAIHRHRGRDDTPHSPPSEDATEHGQAFFFNYFSFGLDLLFAPGVHGGTTLSKMVVHSNTPGHALFGRYKRLPWRLMGESAALGAPSAALTPYTTLLANMRARTRTAGQSQDRRTTARSRTPSGGSGTHVDEDSRHSSAALSAVVGSGSGSGSNSGSDPSSATISTPESPDTMIVDRGSDWYEFKGRLKMDIGSELRPLRLPLLRSNSDSDPPSDTNSDTNSDADADAEDSRTAVATLREHKQHGEYEDEGDTDHANDVNDANDANDVVEAADSSTTALPKPRPQPKPKLQPMSLPKPTSRLKTQPQPVLKWLDGCVAEINRQDGCISCLTLLRP